MPTLSQTTEKFKTFRPWTKENIKELKQLYAEGKTDKEISAVTGRTEVALQQKRTHIGLVAWRQKRKKTKSAVLTATEPKPSLEILPIFNDLKATQSILQALGYKLAIVRLV